MHIAVLGAGIVGISSAWYLRAAGHQVTVIDRQPYAALETSYANGGQLSTGHVEPWATPETLPQILEWRHHENSPLLFRLRADPHQWAWGLRFLRECQPQRSATNFRQLLALGRYSQSALAELKALLSIDFEALNGGILNLYDQPAAWERGQRAAERVNAMGYPRYAISPDEAIHLEPALAESRAHWIGVTYTPQDGSGNARLWTQGLANACAQRGVEFRYRTTIQSLHTHSQRITHTTLIDAQGPSTLDADAFVVALGCDSATLLRPLGLSLPIYPVKGYSITLPLSHSGQGLHTSITDDAHKVVFTRLGNTLRVAGTAEFCGYDLSLNPVRWQALVHRARTLFPTLANYDAPQPWTGLRPATPSNCPIIGPTRWENLFLNSGHGTLGWTLGTGSGKALAHLVDGQRPDIDFMFTSAASSP
ncbi:MAG: D-amino acid dehydrogenase [Betaproteobacteria bacterium]|jgi:Glycine/D-amino acid oxidases (deaminating)|nr:D-amino acid dehydrogenase [Betaproteobacteria bacterium]